MYEQTPIAAAITVAGSIIVTLLTLRWGKRVRDQRAPRDRRDTIFDAYEAMIRQLQGELDRKTSQLTHTDQIIEHLQGDLDQTRDMVRKLRDELATSKEANTELSRQLEEMKAQYSKEAM